MGHRNDGLSHFELVDAMRQWVEAEVQAGRVVALIGRKGTGKTTLAKASAPNALHIDLSTCAPGWGDALRDNSRPVILDEVSNKPRTTLNADVVMEQNDGINGLICLFEVESEMRAYLGDSVRPFTAFYLDPGSYRRQSWGETEQ